MIHDDTAEMKFMLALDYAVPPKQEGKTILADNSGNLFLQERRLVAGVWVTSLRSYPLVPECHSAKGYDSVTMRNSMQ